MLNKNMVRRSRMVFRWIPITAILLAASSGRSFALTTLHNFTGGADRGTPQATVTEKLTPIPSLYLEEGFESAGDRKIATPPSRQISICLPLGAYRARCGHSPP